MIDIVPGGNIALASEAESTAAPNEESAEATDVPDMIEASAPPVETEEQPTNEPTAAPEVTATDEIAATPEVTATTEAVETAEPTEVPEVTPTAKPDLTPELAVTKEAPVKPEVTATPEIVETAEPAEIADPTDTPELAKSPEPTEVLEPLVVSLSSDARSAYAGEDAIVVSLRIEGGVPEYSVTYQVKLNGDIIESNQLLTAENVSSYSYVAHSYGVHTIEVTVTDVAEQTEVAIASIPVAVRDTTSAAEQRRKAEKLQLTGDWREDLAVAASQLGYQESETDFTILEDGAERHYAVYGDWYGQSYGEWCAMFIAYCAHYAEIPDAYVPCAASAQQLQSAMNGKGAYQTRASGYEPEAGDIVFFQEENGASLDRAGIVTAATNSEIRTIEGDRGGTVARASYARDDYRIVGYVSMCERMTRAGVLTEKNRPESATEKVQATIDALSGMAEEGLAAAREAYEAYKALTDEEREQLTGADFLKEALDVESLISGLPSAQELAAMDMDGQRAAYDQSQTAYDAYMALTKEQRALLDAKVFEALFAFFNGQIMLLGYSDGNGTGRIRIRSPRPMICGTSPRTVRIGANASY